MFFKPWYDADGRSPVLETVWELRVTDEGSLRAYLGLLQTLRKYPYSRLALMGMMKRLPGKNPWCIHVMHLKLPFKTAQGFFVVTDDATCWMMHLVILGSEEGLEPPHSDDIEIAESRAAKLNATAGYIKKAHVESQD